MARAIGLLDACTVIDHFDSQVDMQVSTDGGNTFAPVQASAGVDVVVTHQANLGGSEIEMYTTEMAALNMQFLAGNQPVFERGVTLTWRDDDGSAAFDALLARADESPISREKPRPY